MHPYENLPSEAFWRNAVAQRSMFDIENIWSPKFTILPKYNIVTYGSCFAQHLGNALAQKGFNWYIAEKAPAGLSAKNARKYNYGTFSSRTGNIYTTSLLKQWIDWSLDESSIPNVYWEKDGRIYDPFRPAIEPNGFESIEEMTLSRLQTVRKFRESVEQSVVFIFTLGLTESWVDIEGGFEYPMCPGTVAGTFDPTKHKFVNQNFSMILENLRNSAKKLMKINSKLRFIFTVSPVPLTATKTDRNVIVATMASKSILRAVCDEISNNAKLIDYFPSYEIINSPVFKGAFFEPNQRSVNPYGVNFVMKNFFECLDNKFDVLKDVNQNINSNSKTRDEEICEEVMLEAFAK